MYMRMFVVFIIILINFVIQSTVFEYITVFGIKPNTAIIIIVSYSMLRGEIEAALLGFFVGLLQDIYFFNVIGVNALLCSLVGFFCAKIFKDFYRENFLIFILVVAVSFILYEFLFYIIWFLFRGNIQFLFYIRNIILPGMLYTCLFCFPIYKLMYLINEKLEDRERNRRNFY